MRDHGGVIVAALALTLIVVLAALVLVAVAYPYRGRTTARAPWLADALGRLIRRFRPTEPHPAYALLSDPDRDARIRARTERVERTLVELPRRAVRRSGG
jgi:hypothetical protein